MNKKELFHKLENINTNFSKKFNINSVELNYLKKLILNDKLGLKLNFKDTDEDLSKQIIFYLKTKTLFL